MCSHNSRNIFIIPEVIYDTSLFLSPHVFLLAILFSRRAFRLEEFNDNGPEMLETMAVLEDEKSMPIPLKKELYDDYLFRGVAQGINGYSLFDKRVTYHTVHKALQRVGRSCGCEEGTTSYTLRYMAGSNMNESDRWYPFFHILAGVLFWDPIGPCSDEGEIGVAFQMGAALGNEVGLVLSLGEK